MGRLLKLYGKSILTFAFLTSLSVAGFNLLNAQPASAYTITKYFTVYKKGGSYLYRDGYNKRFDIIDFTPQITIKKNLCGPINNPDNDTITRDFHPGDNPLDFNNCEGITIQPVASPWDNVKWFRHANYSYEIGDVDWSETINIGGGRIVEHGSNSGSSTNNPTPAVPNPDDGTGRQNINAKSSTDTIPLGCDDPNPNHTDTCSVLIVFHSDYAGNFNIRLNAGGDDGHEYWYDGPKLSHYRTLTFNPNGGTVAENGEDSDNLIWSHQPSVNLLREYVWKTSATNFPTPVRSGWAFTGWYDSGGTKRTSIDMGTSDHTLTARWTEDEPDEYNLVPSVSLDQSNAIEAGATVTVDPNIENTGNISSPSATWELNRTVDGIANFDGPVPTGSQVFPVGTTNLTDYPDSDTDFDVGTRLCYTLRVRPHATGRPVDEWETSDPPACVTIGKKPKAQIWGGDLVVRGDVITGTSVKNLSGGSRTFGSWVEYGIIASGGISGAASGAAYAGPGLPSATVYNTSRLSFANAENRTNCAISGPLNPGYIGCYTNATGIPDVANNFPSSRLPLRGPIAGNPIRPRNLANGTHTTNNPSLSLLASDLSAGRSVVIKSSGTIRITEDQTYSDGPYTSIRQLPQLVIIARSIIIDDNVRRVDAWLVTTAGGSIRTCSAVASNSNQCNRLLTVNGPVMTDHLYLYRTGGSGTGVNTGNPAEIFNLRADAYLWAQAQAAASGRARTVYITELPPRV